MNNGMVKEVKDKSRSFFFSVVIPQMMPTSTTDVRIWYY